MSNVAGKPKYETPRLSEFELPDVESVAAQWVAGVITLADPAKERVLVVALAELLKQERVRLVDAFARLVRKVNHTPKPSFPSEGGK